MSLWQRHKQRIYEYGHIYATLCGLVVINYIPQRRNANSLSHRLVTVYSHLLVALLGVVAPAYFAWHAAELLEAADRRWQLQRCVSVLNTLIKYVTVLVTYLGNCMHDAALREITRTCQTLEDATEASYRGSARPQRKFETLLLLKFTLVNAMLLLQLANIAALWLSAAPQSLRLHFGLYGFALWNYAENMANYNYFINCSALKFYQQLNWQLRREALEARRQCCQRSFITQTRCCLRLCERLNALALRYRQIHEIFVAGKRMHQLQLLGLLLMMLISNLTNFFTVFNMFSRASGASLDSAGVGADAATAALSTIYACVFYVDTFMVTLVSEYIGRELSDIGHTLKLFNDEDSALDVRLLQLGDSFIESFALQLRTLNCIADFRICGLFSVDLHLTFLTAATGLNYFFTLILFDLDFSGLK